MKRYFIPLRLEGTESVLHVAADAVTAVLHSAYTQGAEVHVLGMQGGYTRVADDAEAVLVAIEEALDNGDRGTT